MRSVETRDESGGRAATENGVREDMGRGEERDHAVDRPG